MFPIHSISNQIPSFQRPCQPSNAHAINNQKVNKIMLPSTFPNPKQKENQFIWRDQHFFQIFFVDYFRFISSLFWRILVDREVTLQHSVCVGICFASSFPETCSPSLHKCWWTRRTTRRREVSTYERVSCSSFTWRRTFGGRRRSTGGRQGTRFAGFPKRSL